MDINKVDDLDTAAFFIEVGKPLAKAKTIKETFDILMYQVGCMFQPMHWSLLLKDPKTGDMVFTVVVGSNKEKLQGVRVAKGEGIAGHILSTGESVIVQKVQEDERFSMRIDEATGFQTRSIIGVPLKTDEKIFGVIELINKISGDNFTEVEMHLLASIAEYAAIAIERSYYNKALKKIALTDPLTGVKNKTSFERVLHNRIDVLKRYNIISALMIIDIKGLKEINNQYGYDSGDLLLKEFAGLLRKSFRVVDEVFRYEADKFTVIMPQTSLDKAEWSKQRLLKQLKSALFIDGSVTVKAAVAIRLVDVDIHREIHSIIKKRKRRDKAEEASLEGMDSGVEPSEFTYSTEKSSFIEEDANIQDMESNLQPMLDEEDVELQNRAARNTVHYKDVMLSGDYRHFNKGSHGYITVVKLSIRAVCFETMRLVDIKSDDILDISFNLDDSRKSLIKRRVRVKSVDAKLVEAEYYNPPPYDKNLGFYLMA